MYQLLRVFTFKLCAVALMVCACTAQAELTIEITQGVDSAARIAVVPFGFEARSLPTAVRPGAGQGAAGSDQPGDLQPETLPEQVDRIISFDLARSGQFAPLPVEDMLSYPTREDEVHFRDWRVQGIEYLVIGRVIRRLDGVYQVSYRLFDVLGQRVLIGGSYTVDEPQLRDAAHRISDAVFAQVTGVAGAFSTQIAYIIAQDVHLRNGTFELQIADADGARARTLLRSNEPLLSPSWSPDGSKLAYVSFENGRPAIYLHDIASGAREALTSFEGLNSAPAFSPDGSRLAMVLSRDGNPEIYTLDIASKQLTRITRHYAIDTEPSWTPDGRGLIFTSNRGGQPQIYRVSLTDGLVDRLTYVGDYNARARMLSDGRHLLFVHRQDGIFHIARLDLQNDRMLVLTSTRLDESPSLAPNDSMVIYATQDGGRGILAVVSIDGRVKYRLPSSAGDVREPAWSPLQRANLAAGR